MPSSELNRRIRWADADAAGRLYYARIFDYFGEGEMELLRNIGYAQQSLTYDFPRVHVECRFLRVLSLDDPFTIQTSVGKLGHTSIRYDFKVFGGEQAWELAA